MKHKSRDAIQKMAIGGLLGGLLGLIGPPAYLFAVFESMVIVSFVSCSECNFDFGEAFIMLLYGMAPALSLSSNVLIAVALTSGANGVVAGLVASMFRSLTTAAVVCGVIASVPAAIYLSTTSLSQYVSNNIIFVYVPSAIYVSTIVLVGVALHQRINPKGWRADV